MPPFTFAPVPPHASALPAGQRGSVLIQFALFLSIIILMLGVVDLGYAFYAKRDLQRIADQAALAAVQGIDFNDPNNINACQDAGNSSVNVNWPAPLDAPTTQNVVCGEWSASKYDAPQYFDGTARPVNAAHVVLVGESLKLLPLNWSRTIRAEAIAKRSVPVAEFSVGSQLLSFDDKAPLGRILSLVGLNLDELRVLDHGGLANAKITPAGLLKALGINLGIDGLSALSPSEVLKISNLTLLQLLDASAEVISDATAKVELDKLIVYLKGKPNITLGGIKVLDLNVPLLGEDGILAGLSIGSNASDNNAALDLQLGLGNLLKTAIMVGANGHAVEIPQLNILNLVKASLTVVEPPSIAAGPVGTKANSAQVRLKVDIDTRDSFVDGLLTFLLGKNTFINIPIQVDGVRADATLDAIQCPDPNRDNQPSMDLFVESSIAKISIGSFEPLLQIKGKTIIASPRKTIHILKSSDEYINSLIKDEKEWTRPNDLLLGDTLGSITDLVFSVLGAVLGIPPSFDPRWDIPSSMSQEEIKKLQIQALANAYIEKSNSQGEALSNIDRVIDVILNGSSDKTLPPLIKSDFTFNNAIPVSCALFVCPPSSWKTGTFSEAFKQYSGVPGSLLDLLGITTLGGGYTSCAGLLSSLLAWNACLENNLNNLLQKNINQVDFGNAQAIINSMKDGSSPEISCSGILCILVDGLLKPVKFLLNGIGKGILSPLLTEVLGLDLGKSEVTAREIQCNTAELVY